MQFFDSRHYFPNIYSSNELFDYLIVKKSTTKLEGPIPRQQKPINRTLGTVAGILSKIFNQKRSEDYIRSHYPTPTELMQV